MQIMALEDLVSGEGLLQIYRQNLFTVFLHGGRGQFGHFKKGTNAFSRSPVSNHLPEIPPLNTMTLGTKFKYMNLGGTPTSRPWQI